MLTKSERRCFKEAFIALAKAVPERASSRRYWMDAPDNEHTRLAVRSMHACDRLPWPDQPCVVASQMEYDVSGRRIDGVQLLALMGSSTAEVSLYSHVLRKELRSSNHYFLREFEALADGNVCHVKDAGNLFFSRVHYDSHEDLLADLLLEGSMARGIGHSIPEAVRSRAKQTLPHSGTECWVLMFHRGDGMVHHHIAADTLSVLAAAAFPCGYRVHATIPGGFGRKELRALTSGPTICYVDYDRLYKVASEAGGVPPEVDPHFRHGHYRHLWKAAGIDRNTLPESPEARMAMAIQFGVRKVYVSPAWVGATEFSAEGVEWRIDTGEVEL